MTPVSAYGEIFTSDSKYLITDRWIFLPTPGCGRYIAQFLPNNNLCQWKPLLIIVQCTISASLLHLYILYLYLSYFLTAFLYFVKTVFLQIAILANLGQFGLFLRAPGPKLGAPRFSKLVQNLRSVSGTRPGAP